MTTAALSNSTAPSPSAPAAAQASTARRVVIYVVVATALATPMIVSRVFPFVPAWVPAASGFGFGVVAALALKAGRILLPVGAAVAGLLTFLFGYGTVAFDNPTPEPMTIVVDGDRKIELAAWGHTVEYMPIGEYRFTGRAGDLRGAFTGAVSPHGHHLASPVRGGCYGLFEHVYGALSGADTHGDEHFEGKHWYDLEHVDYMFERAPSSVSTKSSGEARRELQRAMCKADVDPSYDADVN